MSKRRKQLFMTFMILYTLGVAFIMLRAIYSVYYSQITLPASTIPVLDKGKLGGLAKKLEIRENPVATASVDLRNYRFGKAEPFQ